MKNLKKILYSIVLGSLIVTTATAMQEDNNAKKLSNTLLENISLNIKEKNNIIKICPILITTAKKILSQGNLYWLDPNIGNDQCHWSSLMLAEICCKQLLNEKLSEDEELYITLCLLLSTSLANNKNKEKLSELVTPSQAQNTLKNNIRAQINSIINNKNIILNAKKLCNNLLLNYTLKAIDEEVETANEENRPLLKEIKLVIDDKIKKNLLCLTDIDENNQIVRIPKIIGIVPWILRIKRLGLPIVYKIKVVHPNGVHSVVMLGNKNDSQKLPTMVIEGVACDQPFSNYANTRKNCLNNLWNPNTISSHSCGCCQKCSEGEDCKVLIKQQEELSKIPTDDIILAISASFTQTNQIDYVNNIITNTNLIKETYEKYLKLAKETGLNYKKPDLLVIEHIHTDIGARTLQTDRLVDTNWSKTLEKLYK